MEKGWIRILSSIPLVGNAIGLFAENTAAGVAQYGWFLGLLRGGLIGLVLAITLLILSEGTLMVFSVIREGGDLYVTAMPKTEMRKAIMANETKKIYESLMHPGSEVNGSGLSFYVVKNTVASVYNDEGLNFEGALNVDPDVISRGFERADDGARIVPFFRYDETDEGGLADHPEKNSVATVTDRKTKAEYVVAQLNNRLILIPLPEYKAAGLPMKGVR